ncbi:MAG: DUF6261 family protein [Puniceicoccales bacterium]|nr:DUF6261 family protein [Puniceicoccales bacterium]
MNEYNISEIFESLVQTYNGHYDNLDVAMEVVRRSVYTGQMRVADQQRKSAYRRLRVAAFEFTKEDDPNKRLAAERIANIIRHYGNFATGPRAERTYALTNMLQDLREKCAVDLQLLGLAAWVGELEAKNLAYKELKSQRHTEKSEVPVMKVPEARLEVDASYAVIVKQLAAHHAWKPDDDNCATLIAKLNNRVDYYNNLLAQRRGVSAARKARQEEATVSFSSSSSESEVA